MDNASTNLFGILLAIFGGTYFYISHCSACATSGATNDELHKEVSLAAPIEGVSNEQALKDDKGDREAKPGRQSDTFPSIAESNDCTSLKLPAGSP